MHDARRVGAFFSGLFLYIAAIACASALADYHLPREIYSKLGGRASPAVLTVEALLIALLLFVAALGWSFITLRRPRKSRHSTVAWFMSGIGAAWLGALIFGVFLFALNPRNYQSMSSLLLSSDSPPLWGLFNIVAVVSAAAIAEAVARRLNPMAATHYRTSSTRASSRQSRTSPA